MDNLNMRICECLALMGSCFLPVVLCATAFATPAPRDVVAVSSVKKPDAVEINEPRGDNTYSCTDYHGTPFKWGMSRAEVTAIIEEKFRLQYQPQIEATSDPIKQDFFNRKRKFELDYMYQSSVSFPGDRSIWDNSPINGEYGFKNNESVVVFRELECARRRFLFFWNQKLYKQFYDLDNEKFPTTAFSKFAADMEIRFGKAKPERLYSTSTYILLDGLTWQIGGDYVLRLYDKSGTCGHISLVLLQKSVYLQVEKERLHNYNSLNSPPPRYRLKCSEPPSGVEPDPNENIVDEVLGTNYQPAVEQRRVPVRKVNKKDTSIRVR